MQNLNLINPEKSDIKYDIIEFSDGESHIKFTTEVNRKDRVQVLCRISSMRDLFILMQVADILNRMEVEWALVITYLMGMRMDRVISFNEAYTLKVVAKAINDMHAGLVCIVEPHSDKTLTLIKNSQSIMSKYAHMAKLWDGENNRKFVLVFPDAGAKLRYADIVGGDGGTNYTGLPVVTCKKKRNPDTGALSGFEIENPEVIENLPDGPDYTFMVIDDLCDGGGTFCGISELLGKAMPNAKRALAVTHAVSQKGIINVNNYYDEVFITNSYKDWEKDEFVASHDNIHVLAVEQSYFNM